MYYPQIVAYRMAESSCAIPILRHRKQACYLGVIRGSRETSFCRYDSNSGFPSTAKIAVIQQYRFVGAPSAKEEKRCHENHRRRVWYASPTANAEPATEVAGRRDALKAAVKICRFTDFFRKRFYEKFHPSMRFEFFAFS